MKIACSVADPACYGSNCTHMARWRGPTAAIMRCGYMRCLVHHPGKPLLCPPVSMLRIDTRIQQAVPSLKSAGPIVLPVFVK